MTHCKKCNKEITEIYGSGTFCSISCANSRVKKKKNIQCLACNKDFIVSLTSKRKFCSVECSNKKKMEDPERKEIVNSLWNVSSRTRSKILSRIKTGCCRCGWNEGSCDLHHINGKKIKNPHNDSNLALLCPNCHRLYHQKKIGPNDVISIDKYLGDWKKFYFG